MNPLIYKALQQFVLDVHDADTWDEIVARAHATSRAETDFHRVNGSGLSHLVAVAAEITEQDTREMLEAAARNWIMRHADQVTDRLVRANSASFGFNAERNVHHFHNGIGMIFPALRPPVLFWRVESPMQSRLEYVWHRDEFAGFLLGLLSGVAGCFDERMQVTEVPQPAAAEGQPSSSIFLAVLDVAEQRTAA